jgi:hypothetical protein
LSHHIQHLAYRRRPQVPAPADQIFRGMEAIDLSLLRPLILAASRSGLSRMSASTRSLASLRRCLLRARDSLHRFGLLDQNVHGLPWRSDRPLSGDPAARRHRRVSRARVATLRWGAGHRGTPCGRSPVAVCWSRTVQRCRGCVRSGDGCHRRPAAGSDAHAGTRARRARYQTRRDAGCPVWHQ